LTAPPAQRLSSTPRPRLRLVAPPLIEAETFGVLGARLTLTPPDELAPLLVAAPRQGRHARVHFVTAETVLAAARDPDLLALLAQADLLAPDDDALVLHERMRRKPAYRIGAGETLLAVLDLSRPREYRHFFLGLSPALSSALVEGLRARFPGLDIRGSYLPPMQTISWRDVDEVTRMVNDAAPHYVWVCLPSPEQDRWLACLRPLLHAPLLVGVGALLGPPAAEGPRPGRLGHLRRSLGTGARLLRLLLAAAR